MEPPPQFTLAFKASSLNNRYGLDVMATGCRQNTPIYSMNKVDEIAH